MFGHSAKRVEPGPGQESVWDYPRPPRLEPSSRHIENCFQWRHGREFAAGLARAGNKPPTRVLHPAG